MEERLAKVEQAYEDIRKDIESKLEKTQWETRDHISRAQEDLLAKIAAMLGGQSSEKRKEIFIDPSALTNNSGLPLKTQLSVETPAAKQLMVHAESSTHGGGNNSQ
ncbi:hypothetical protein HRI_001487600 [Hibiscus trionum]|uniref:Uncharacterized protein n=1 Tax=Hibiscus trionum TaxID=183268 RepID=A0A9W7LVL4_HIBTR|nr:hypothetical protein HRI_001487600 [Hibiscus trionum]